MNQERHDLLTIGSFAAATRLSLKALRLYSQLGILAPRFVATLSRAIATITSISCARHD